MNEFDNRRGPMKWYVKSVYGTNHKYWHDSKDQEHWKQLTGRTTFTDKDMVVLHVMFDVSFEQVLPPKAA